MKNNYCEIYTVNLYAEADFGRAYIATVYGDELRFTVNCGSTWCNVYNHGALVTCLPWKRCRIVDKDWRTWADAYGTYTSGAIMIDYVV